MLTLFTLLFALTLAQTAATPPVTQVVWESPENEALISVFEVCVNKVCEIKKPADVKTDQLKDTPAGYLTYASDLPPLKTGKHSLSLRSCNAEEQTECSLPELLEFRLTVTPSAVKNLRTR